MWLACWKQLCVIIFDFLIISIRSTTVVPLFPDDVVYVAYMVMVDVPMYLERWRSNQQSGKFKPMSLHVGWWDAWGRRVVTQEWKVWKHEVAWLTGYFSVAVWTSIAMNHFPRTSA
jgi:hypothetical protein